jgi:hypothetical protein
LIQQKRHDLKYLAKRLQNGWMEKWDPVEVRGTQVYLIFPNGDEYLLTEYGDSDYSERMSTVMKTIFDLEKRSDLIESEEDSILSSLKRYFTT